uniref:Uncharacterized protein n=1 Tax=Anguilla anguilla TaxID=7936 RepID=A0A0E9PT10_ANGAN
MTLTAYFNWLTCSEFHLLTTTL